ncbi:MAG: hypothetical protein JNL21_12850 [Myxococcales bacterium]|nr:hypothetical protein [Myxococcales bacterium]
MGTADDLDEPAHDKDGRAEEPEADAADRAAVLRRRAVFVARAIGSLALPALVGGCSDPQPCLNIASPRELTPSSEASGAGSSAPPASASASASSSAASSSAAPSTSAAAPALAPLKDGVFSITKAEASALRLPAIGFRVTMKRGGLSVQGPSRAQYVSASGPPGGPLAFIAKPYNDGVSDQAALEVLFRRALSDWSGFEPIEAGPAETVTVGGKKLEAQSFRTGKSLATTNWCVVKVPAAKNARDGVLFLFGVGTGESAKPSCKPSLQHQALAEIVSTLVFEE